MTYQPQMLEPPLTRWNEAKKREVPTLGDSLSPEIPTCVFVISLHETVWYIPPAQNHIFVHLLIFQQSKTLECMHEFKFVCTERNNPTLAQVEIILENIV